MALTAGDERGPGHVPDRDEVVLPAGQDVFSIWGPADADETAVVGVEVIEQPLGTSLAS